MTKERTSRVTCSVTLQLALLVALSCVTPTRHCLAQNNVGDRITSAYRGTDLGAALRDLAERSGVTIAFESGLVAGIKVFCVAEDQPIETILTCLLRDTELDFFRLSTGAYVLAGSAKQNPVYGYMRGIVLDGGSGVPLADANVSLDSRKIGTATNSAGQFVLPPLLPGSYTVTVSHVSYRPWSGMLDVGPGHTSSTFVQLQPRTVFVSPIIVGDAAASSTQPPSSSTTPNVDNSSDPFRTLNELSGVRINDVTADIRVDGSSPGEVLTLLDGVPVFLPRTEIVSVGPFSALAIDRFTVHGAGFGVRSGSFVSGVVEASHGASADVLSHVQMDPSGVNARIGLGTIDSRLTGMLAGRVGLWQVFAPNHLSDVLASWSAADPFLLVAPTRQYQFATESFITDTLNLKLNTRPAVRYTDLHGSVRYRVTPLRSVDASVYVGRNGLVGDRVSSTLEFANADGYRASDLSIGDNYEWTNASGQLRYSTFVGNRTLAQIQGKASSYRLEHGYELIENLYIPIDGELASVPDPKQNTASDVDDRNDVRYAALSLSVDHAREKHQLGFGIEASHFATKLSLRTATAQDSVRDGAPVQNAVEVVAGSSVELGIDGGLSLVALFAEDRWEPADFVTITAGVRATLVPQQRSVFAEPRLAISVRGSGPVGRWWMQTAGGLYRQFFVQTDVSKLNAGSLLPSVRVWIPVSGTVRPPTSYHLRQSFSASPSKYVTMTVDGFGKFHTRGYALDYAHLASLRGTTLTPASLLSKNKTRILGASIRAELNSNLFSGSVRYGYLYGRTEDANRFAGRETTVPGLNPQELDLRFSVRPAPAVVFSVAWHSALGRTFGFTPAYYNYFGQNEGTDQHGTINLGDPDSHRLPANKQLDVSAALARQLGRFGIQIRTDILNVLDRDNVAEWRLVYADGELKKSSRPLYPRLSTISLRVSW